MEQPAGVAGGGRGVGDVEAIEFFFDVMCPYCYQSSKWVRTVREHTGLAITWSFFSLEEINREAGKKHPWERDWSYGWSQMRIGAALRRQGMDDLDRWYAAVGRAFHEDGRPTQDPAVQREVLAEIGFDPELVATAIADPTTSDEVRADHERSVRTYGAFGVPTMVFPSVPGSDDPPEGRALYQQLVPAPEGDAAVELFDLFARFRRFPELFEVKHPKLGADVALVAERFAPYLAARTWRTIENPAP